MQNEYTVIKTYTIESIYPSGYMVPAGYTDKGFRPPKKGEQFISSPWGSRDRATFAFEDNAPRLIIEAMPVGPRLRSWLIEVQEDELSHCEHLFASGDYEVVIRKNRSWSKNIRIVGVKEKSNA